MTNNFLPWFLACLFMLGFIALVIFAYTSAFKNVRNFTSAVKEKMSSWDEFVTRTGLKWELRQPGVTNANDNPVSTKLFWKRSYRPHRSGIGDVSQLPGDFWKTRPAAITR